MNEFFACPVCGYNVIKTADTKEVKSELGFGIHVPVYQCIHCGKKFMICPDCVGTKFIENENGINDCPMCNGMGIIEFPEEN